MIYFRFRSIFIESSMNENRGGSCGASGKKETRKENSLFFLAFSLSILTAMASRFASSLNDKRGERKHF